MAKIQSTFVKATNSKKKAFAYHSAHVAGMIQDLTNRVGWQEFIFAGNALIESFEKIEKYAKEHNIPFAYNIEEFISLNERLEAPSSSDSSSEEEYYS